MLLLDSCLRGQEMAINPANVRLLSTSSLWTLFNCECGECVCVCGECVCVCTSLSEFVSRYL